MISTLVTLLVGLLIIGLISYIAHAFIPDPKLIKLVNVICVVLAVLLLIYCVVQFAGGAGASVGMAANLTSLA